MDDPPGGQCGPKSATVLSGSIRSPFPPWAGDASLTRRARSRQPPGSAGPSARRLAPLTPAPPCGLSAACMTRTRPVRTRQLNGSAPHGFPTACAVRRPRSVPPLSGSIPESACPQDMSPPSHPPPGGLAFRTRNRGSPQRTGGLLPEAGLVPGEYTCHSPRFSRGVGDPLFSGGAPKAALWFPGAIAPPLNAGPPEHGSPTLVGPPGLRPPGLRRVPLQRPAARPAGDVGNCPTLSIPVF
jgi:hypothetical protein